MAISHEHGVTTSVKERLFGGLAIASDLVTLGGAVFPLAAAFFTDIDLGAVLMSTTAAFELGGAVLGTIEVQIAKGWTSNVGLRQCRRGFNSPTFPPYFDPVR